MTNVAPERFLKYVNLRSPQTAKEPEETKKDYLIPPPRGFRSELLKEVQKGKIESREELMKVAHAVYKQSGSIDEFPDDLNAEIVEVFSEHTVRDAKDKFSHIFEKTPAAFLGSSAVKKMHYQAWENYYCLAVAPSKFSSERQKYINIIKRFYAIVRLGELRNSEALPKLTEINQLKPLLPKALFPRFKKKDRPISEVDKELIHKMQGLLSQLNRLDSIRRKVKKEDRRIYLGKDRNKISLRPKPIVKKGAKSTGMELDVPEPENWLMRRIERESGGDLKPKERLFTADELTLLKNNKEFVYGSTELDAIEKIQKKLYDRGKTLIYHPRQATSARVANHPATQQVLKKLRLPKQKILKKGAAVTSTADESRVHQLGVGDLYVLEQQVNRYEMGEVAHIENVMAKETRDRTHTRINETENTFVTETEETITDEKSLQTTDRYELSKEAEKQLEASLEASAGFSVSASYGPVTAGANGDISSSTSASSSQTTSTSFAREVVEKSVSQITSRIREENTTRVLNRVEEVNSHGFVNDTDKNLCGIYRWVDKYYTVRNVNYGRRLMLEVIIPEPAAGFLYAEQMHPEHEEIAPPPPAINFDADAITRSNYQDYITIYGATDVKAPPENIIYKSVNLSDTRDGEYGVLVKNDTSVSIDNGYKTTNFYGNYQYMSPTNKTDDSLDILVGNKRFGDTTELSGVVGNVSLSVLAKASGYHAGLRIRCELSDQAYEDWQIETWNALQSAYKANVAEYEAKVAAAEIGTGVEIHGRNPGQNEEIIRTELKRSAIKYLSEDMQEIIVNGDIRTNEIFDAADSTGDFDLDEGKVEGAIIQFFEQAFEWKNMMWQFYPYFWARASEQHHKLLAHDHDPIFRDFRRAGAARVVIPVPIVYQDAVLHFFSTNEVWNGGDTPVLDDPEYISIVDDLRNGQLNSFNSPIYYQDEDSVPPYIVDEWEIKLPTSLVKLQSDDQLPNFTTSLVETDAETLLDNLAISTNFTEEWRNSIVNLLDLLDISSTEDSRRSLAESKGYPANAQTDAIHNINEWLYDYLMADINSNGLPD